MVPSQQRPRPFSFVSDERIDTTESHSTDVFFTPPMLDFGIVLEARNPARRCCRHYRVEAGTDLFGSWVVEISYGRIGTAGRSRSFVVRDEGEAQRLSRRLLKRRATASRRTGIPYRVRELIDPEGWARSHRVAIAQ